MRLRTTGCLETSLQSAHTNLGSVDMGLNELGLVRPVRPVRLVRLVRLVAVTMVDG